MAQGVPRPEGLPPGPARDLVHALHDLYRDAGLPSMRSVSNAIRRRNDLPATVSHETVGQLLRGDGVPGWAKVHCVVEHLAGIAVHRPDVDATVERFHRLWLATVSDSVSGTVGATTPAPSTARRPAKPPVEPPAAPAAPAAEVADLDGDIPPRNVRFVGRDRLIHAIHEMQRTGAPIVTLSGIGGVGKTEIALEYLHRHRDDYDLVWWIPAEHRPQLRASLAELGSRLNLPGSEAMQHPPKQVLDALRRSALRWLLVLDDAGAPRSLPSLNDLGAGRVLITSRDPDWTHRGSYIEVGVFERAESVRLLRDRADLDETDAGRLAERLGDLPLAVEQVATWQLATSVPVAGYLDDLDKQMRTILSDERSRAAHYPATVIGFLHVAFERLAEAAPAAAQLLELFAWVGAEPLSVTLLRSGRQGAVSAPLRDALRHAPTLNSAVRELRRHGLVTVVGDDPVRIQVHRVFQQVLRDWLGETRLARGRANVQAILAAANPGAPDDSRFWGHYAEVGPHVDAADLATADEFEARRVALDQVRYLYRIGHYTDSRALAMRLVAGDSRGGRAEADHHVFVLARHHLGNASRMLGDYAAASRVTREALEYLGDHPEFGPQFEYIADLDKNRAVDLRIAGAYTNALTVDEASLRRQLRNDVDDQDKVRTIRNNVAVSLRLLGRFAEAHDIDEEIVAQWADARGARDPRTLFARSNLARDLYGLGRYADALAEVRALLPVYRDVVGPHHHGVLLAVRTEVMASRKLGEYASALRLAEQNRRDLTIWLGTRHEYPLAAGISLSNARLATGDLGTATVETRQLYDDCAQLFGAEHPMTLAVLVDFGSVLRALGDVHGARRRDERAAGELRRVLGESHPYTLCANHNLAVDLALLGQPARAATEAESVLARSRAARGDAHPDTLAAAVNVALAGSDRQGLADALAGWERHVGGEHPDALAARTGRWLHCDIEPPPT